MKVVYLWYLGFARGIDRQLGWEPVTMPKLVCRHLFYMEKHGTTMKPHWRGIYNHTAYIQWSLMTIAPWLAETRICGRTGG